ncbi:hypothetical protein SAMN05720766_1207 [Fibrobacter sp. UWH9]|uniref:hypothetical protein n=1 Tax=Fibrobacter sp. UWH9 TaxID=1896213 RepID=UPI00091339DD|nr:hypothetical protein [Fibrobacter sp. UWH9]SHH70546.1 hypothetical protein SAMN05720766_1207 [Fibrobacter sp. UWH9]
MAKKVDDAFAEFMKDDVDLDPTKVDAAKSSKSNLLDNIKDFDDGKFFRLYSDINIEFGSFARKTKIRPLDDIDIMIGIAADGATYNQNDAWNNVKVTASTTNAIQKSCANFDGTLNSTAVLNRFLSKLKQLPDYKKSEIHKNGEAVTLNLTSREWAFDIVPCFQTVVEEDNRNYYLIPNGRGGWQKTDPRVDRDYVKSVNSMKNGRVLSLVRLCKKWFEVKRFETPASYLLETLIVRYCDRVDDLNQFIDCRFSHCLKSIVDDIQKPIYDMKGIQGDINNISVLNRIKIASKANSDYQKSREAIITETKLYDQESAINIWHEIFGEDFPTYG